MTTPIPMYNPDEIPTMTEYLVQRGVLQDGSDEEIAQAKREYRKMYKRWHQRMMRKGKRFFQPGFTRDEVRRLQAAMKTLGSTSLTALIHDAALAYLDRQYLVIRPELVEHIEVLLARTYSSIRSIADQIEEGRGSTRVAWASILRTVEELERKLTEALRQPREARTPENKQL